MLTVRGGHSLIGGKTWKTESAGASFSDAQV